MVPGDMIVPYEVHVPSFRGTATEGWEPPSTDCEPTLHALGEHYLLSASGFPPENADDLALPVVDVEGRLHRTALVRARRELRERDDITVSTATTGMEVVSRLLDRAFEGEPSEVSAAEATLADLSAPSMDADAERLVEEASRDPIESDERRDPQTQ